MRDDNKYYTVIETINDIPTLKLVNFGNKREIMTLNLNLTNMISSMNLVDEYIKGVKGELIINE